MAITTTAFNIPLTYRTTVDTDCEGVAENNVTGSAATLYSVEIVGIGADVYLRLYDTDAATTGTTVPYLILFCRQNTRYTCHIPGGLSFSAGLSLACTTDIGGSGLTSPGSSVVVRLVTT